MGNFRLFRAPFVLPLSSILWVLASPLALAADNPDRWYDAKEIHFTITGIFDGRYNVDSSTSAHFNDRVEIEFVTTADGTLVGEVTLRNFPSEISNIKASEPGCIPTVLQGQMEFFTVQAFECMSCNAQMAPYAEPDEDGNVPRFMSPSSVITWQRAFPAMLASQFCTSKTPKAAYTSDDGDMFYVPGIGDFLMSPGQASSDKVAVKPGAGVVVRQDGGWAWTYQGVPVGSQ